MSTTQVGARMWQRVYAVGLMALVLIATGATAQQAPKVDTAEAALQELVNGLIGVEEADVDRETLAYRTNFPLAKLNLRKARLRARSPWGATAGAVQELVQQGLDALDRLDKGRPYYAQKGKLTDLAYIADCDGTVQPYYLHLPENYDPSQDWPLIVFLHGYVPSISVLDPWVLGEDVCQIAEDNGCILLIPYGRRNTDFQGVGEVDVLAATDQVKSIYSIDEGRVYISGVSMGGMGAWNMALRHPGMYAAACPMSGHTDMHVWWRGVLPNWPVSRDDIPPFRRFLVEWDNPVDLVMNGRNQPMFVQHGELDRLIPVTQSRTMVQAAADLGIDIKFHEFTGESHYIYWELPCFKNAWGWVKDFALEPGPERITYKTYSLEYDTSYWLQIADFIQWGRPATVDCRVTDGGAGLTITTDNIRLLKIDVQQAPLQKIEDFDVVLNGKPMQARATANWDLYVPCNNTAVEERDWPPRKRKGLCGPVEEVFDTAFVVVAGLSGDAKQDEHNATNAVQWATEWDQFADGLPRLMTDADVTDEDISKYNLVLFGTPKTNSVLARIADKLPIRIGEGPGDAGAATPCYTVGGKTYEGQNLGLVMCYPNPLAPERYVAIYSGELYGKKCGINHKHDLIPDFIVFKGDQDNYDDTNQHVVAGYFDMDWKLNESLTWISEQ